MPDNIGEFRLELGVPEILNGGKDITLVTYGSTVKIALEAVRQLGRSFMVFPLNLLMFRLLFRLIKMG